MRILRGMNRLREIRESKGLSLSEVAKGLHTTPMTIQRFEAGTRNVSLRWLTKLALFYKIDLSELVAKPGKGSDNARMLLSELTAAAIEAVKEPKMAEITIKRTQDKISAYFWPDVEKGRPPTYEQVLRLAQSLLVEKK